VSPPIWVADQASFEALVEEVRAERRYAIDTEFHRERSYYPRLALFQIAWAEQVALVDPLALDVRPLAKVLEGPGIAVLHAALQDLEVLQRACGTIPARLLDTQLMAGFVGYGTPSLQSLLAAELGVTLPKADRLTDWLARPLTAEQVAYAAADVAHLLDLVDALDARLDGLGRRQWSAQECEVLRTRPVGPGAPDDAWLRLKDVRTLKRSARGVAQAVAGWREERAARTDVPVRTVLPDLAVLSVAQRAPHGLDELRSCRGVEERHWRGGLGREILAAVERGRGAPAEIPDRAEQDLDRALRPAVALVSAWVSQVARDRRLDPTLLATRADLVALVQGDGNARLAGGWRAEMLGEDVKRLVAGDAALAFDGRGGLRLVALDGADRDVELAPDA
jgi:ribonuclease D